MSARLRFHILGCGSSGGVPRIGGHWGDCDPANPKNRRRRCSMLVERETDQGVTRVLIDTSPDMRDQLIDAGVGALDGVIYTHSHADHVHGVDDLRMVVFNMRERVNVWADQTTCDALLDRFGYVFIQPEGSSYPPILNLNLLNGRCHHNWCRWRNHIYPVWGRTRSHRRTWVSDQGFGVLARCFSNEQSRMGRSVRSQLLGFGRVAARSTSNAFTSGTIVRMD